MDSMIKNVVESTIKDIERVQNFKLPELGEYWLRYPEEVPENLRALVSRQIFSQTRVRVLWISGTEVQVVLQDTTK